MQILKTDTNEYNYYYFIGIEVGNSRKLSYEIEQLIDIIHRSNHHYTQIKLNQKLFLFSTNQYSIQLILKSNNAIDDINIKNLNFFIRQLKKVAYTIIEDTNPKVRIVYKIEIHESVANEMIISQREKKAEEFDLVTASSFNSKVKEILDNELINNHNNIDNEEIEDYQEDTEIVYSEDIAFPNPIPPRERNKYSPKSNKAIKEIISKLPSEDTIQREVEILRNLSIQMKKPISYIINVPYQGAINQFKLADIFISIQHNTDILKKTGVSKLMLDRIINTSSFIMDRRSKLTMPIDVRNNSVIIEDAEKVETLSSNKFNDLANLLKNHASPVILMINESKLQNKLKKKEYVNKLKTLMMFREISIIPFSEEEYFEKIKQHIESTGYKVNADISYVEAIEVIKNTYGDKLIADNTKVIAEQLVFKYLSSGNYKNSNAIDLSMLTSINPNKADSSELITKTGLKELDKLIGLHEAKEKVKQLLSYYRLNKEKKEKGLNHENICMHMVLKGNPGTGKTTFARILGQILKEEGILKKGELIEVGREDLVARYVGWTAKTVSELFEKAMDSVLFIDEAYLLATDSGNNSGYGSEAIGTIVQKLDELRNRVVVIMAGYPKEMEELIDTNPGLRDRIGITIDMPDFTEKELTRIFKYFCNEKGYVYSEEVEAKIYEYISNAIKNKGKNFGNARFIRKLLERILIAQSTRLSTVPDPSINKLTTIEIEDLNVIYRDFDLNNKVGEKKIGF